MNLKEYYEFAISAAEYPDIGKNIEYPLLGLLGEIGEISNKIKKTIRDDNNEITDLRRSGIKNELGDLCWYIANICKEMDIDFALIDQTNDLTSFITPKTRLDLLIDMAQIFVNISCMNYPLIQNNMFKKSVIYDLRCLFLDIKKICSLYQIDITEVLNENKIKLQDRKLRGVIKGDGDSR